MKPINLYAANQISLLKNSSRYDVNAILIEDHSLPEKGISLTFGESSSIMWKFDMCLSMKKGTSRNYKLSNLKK